MRGNFTYDEAIAMYRKSMAELQTDYIDYYLLHNMASEDVFNRRFKDNGVIDFLLKEREAGRIRNLGFSFHGNKEGFDSLVALHDKYHWDFVQIQLNWMDWTHAGRGNTNAEYLQAELDKRGIQSIIMEPLLGGRLAKVPDHIAERLMERNPHGSVASWAFRFAGTHEGVLTVLSGMTYMEHLQDNLKTYSPLVPLTEEEMAFLEETAELMKKYPTVPCNDCKYCMPCPYGIDIPAILLHYNKCVNEGYVSNGQEDDNYRKARRAYLVSYDRAVPKLRQADRCIGCNQCSVNCPQKIDIPKEIHKIGIYIEKLKREG
jgi:predicted aldo/keto reductase-like oxidoreductase